MVFYVLLVRLFSLIGVFSFLGVFFVRVYEKYEAHCWFGLLMLMNVIMFS